MLQPDNTDVVTAINDNSVILNAGRVQQANEQTELREQVGSLSKEVGRLARAVERKV